MDKLLPCPWCKSKQVEAFPAHAASYAPSVLCHMCGNAVDAEDAIAAWNAIPRQPQWTKYTGNEDTMPPILAAIIVEDGEAKFACRHSADGECYDVDGDGYTLPIGAKWMPWPGGE